MADNYKYLTQGYPNRMDNPEMYDGVGTNKPVKKRKRSWLTRLLRGSGSKSEPTRPTSVPLGGGRKRQIDDAVRDAMR